MAVVVASSKVDYSVTKGGLKLWAVILVFVILCSSLYTLFSAKQSGEVAFEIDDDGNIDYDGDIDDDGDEMAMHNRRAEKDTTPSREYISGSRIIKESRKVHQPVQDVSDSGEDDRLDEEERLEEEIRLANLRAKAEKKLSKLSNELENNNEDAEGSDDDDDDEDGDDDDDDNKISEEDDKGVTEEEYGTKVPERIEGEGEDSEKEKKQLPNEELVESEKDDGKRDEDSEGNEKEEYFVKPKFKLRKKHRIIQSFTADQPKRECKRKNCPSENSHPRMSLLKQVPLSMSSRSKQKSTKSTSELVHEDGRDDESSDKDSDRGRKIDNGDTDEADFSNLAAVKKEKLTDAGIYKRHAITNRDDHRYRDQLDRADYLVEKHDYRPAIAIFESILRNNPDSPRAHFGIARANDIRSESESDYKLLDIAINEYQEVLDIDDTPDALFNQAAYRLIDRARFRGALHRVLQAQRSLIDRYPDDLQLHNDQGLTFLMMGRKDDARLIFENVLKVSPTNGIAQAYFGYILKLNGDLENGVFFMRKGLRSAREVIADPRFYYHFGDALTRLGRKKEAFQVYSIGVKVGLFISPYQRSLYNVEGLSARPWWSVEQTSCSKHLKSIERQWAAIREEAVLILNSQSHLFQSEHKELVINGQWSSYYLYKSNTWNSSNCLQAPKTCSILRLFKDSCNCLKSEIKFSLLTSGTRTWPHCGYSNCLLQAHLGLVVSSEARLRVADEVRGWKAGRFLIFDDSFEHELWFEGASANKYRLTLKLDLWHPDIDPIKRVEFPST
ncbi:unnamed protein product [Thelazia callipaeda]|uniref:TPR_REGION domain-containing protein n=1 Tax=Thelazia callipaeda TaxID=103827 RepID=A0A0N5CKM6_THECL|nr:unnamed protein product [Thelazia callipaeda]